ncbi:TlpA family protein disulfide reductase [Flavobacterium sp. LaA7.5]|nr:TlpA family protein disulfide reductase [Flavobacterium salilacus subsp. altitudinum]
MKKALWLLLACTGVYAQSEIQNFKGVIKNSMADSIVVKKQPGSWNQAYVLNKGGEFSGKLQQGLGMFTLHYGDKEINMYLGNDSDITITANGDNFIETIKYTGKGADENNFLADYARGRQTLMKKYEDSGEKEAISKDIDKLIADFEERLKKSEYNFMFKNTIGSILKYSEKQMLPIEIRKQSNANKLEDKPSPQFTYENHNGGTTALSDLKGKYVYIDVWATWCAPCRKEIPHLQELEEKYKDKNIAFVSISIDKQKDHEKWEQMVKENSLGGIQLIADKDWESDFIQAYDVISIPRFILVDPKGNVVKANAPRPSEPAITELLDNLLK